MRRTSLLGLVALVALVTAGCSAGTDSVSTAASSSAVQSAPVGSTGPSGVCVKVKALIDFGRATSGKPLSQDQIDSVTKLAEDARDASPADLADAWNRATTVVRGSMVVGLGGPTDQEARAKLKVVLEDPATAPELERLDAWAKSTCGVNLGLGSTSSSAGTKTTPPPTR